MEAAELAGNNPAAIAAAFATIHQRWGWAANTTIAGQDTPEVHVPSADVATIFFHMDFLKDGKPIAGVQRAMIVVAMRKHGVRKVAAGQLTKETVAPAG